MYFNPGLIPWYLTMKAYHLNNNFLLYIIPSAISAYYVVLLKTFFEQMSPSLEESAKLDGAGIFTVFLKIVFPLSKSIVATIAVFASLGQWNEWFSNYILVSDPKLQTLQLILYNYLNEASAIARRMMENKSNTSDVKRKITPTAIRMTITMVVTIPILFVYPFMQKYFVKGIMLGAVKG
jgi:ABC-type glycerol-3-phosphate transport system permease component